MVLCADKPTYPRGPRFVISGESVSYNGKVLNGGHKRTCVLCSNQSIVQVKWNRFAATVARDPEGTLVVFSRLDTSGVVQCSRLVSGYGMFRDAAS